MSIAKTRRLRRRRGVESLRQHRSEWITHVLPAPDGERIAYASQRYTANAWLLELKEGR